MAQFKHTPRSFSEAEQVFANARKNKHGHVSLGNNTVLVKYEDTAVGSTSYAVRLHYTDVVEFSDDGRIFFNTGGWVTSTTIYRMHAFTPAYVLVRMSKGEVIVSQRFDDYAVELLRFTRRAEINV